MRRRLLWSMLAAAAVAVLLLGLPLGLAVGAQYRSEAVRTVEREAEQIRVVLQRTTSLRQALLVMEALADAGGVRLTVIGADGAVVHDTGMLVPGDQVDDPAVAVALRGSAVRSVRRGVVAVVLPARLGGSDVALRVWRDDVALRGRVRTAWLAIAGLAGVALAAAAALALWQGRRLASPLEALASSARRLGDGDFSARAPRSGVPESDAVAEALDTTAGRLSTVLERGRSFSADTSHQLRTPLTALRLDLEGLDAIVGDPTAAGLVDASLREADRLEATIDELLALSQPPSVEELVDLGDLAAHRLPAWQSLARARGRRVILQHATVPAVRVRPAAIGQALQVLLDNALEHGEGTVTVSVQHMRRGRPVDPLVPAVVTGEAAQRGGESPSERYAPERRDAGRPGATAVGQQAAQERRRPAWVRLCVADEGPGMPDAAATSVTSDAADGESGRGLPLARSLIEAEGGRIRVEPLPRGVMVCLLLPAVDER